MPTSHARRIAGLIAALLVSNPAWAQAPLGSAFTYQGRLTDGSQPANGAYDLELRLFTAGAGGAAVGLTVVRDDVSVTGGLFTVSLDFGPGAFAGAARWLEVAVRPGSSTGAYTTLAPRQELTPSPNALFSATSPWAGLVGVPAGFADGIDNVGEPGWSLAGNAGTNPATQFLGTTDAQPLVFRAAGRVALRLEGGSELPNVIGGSGQNAVTAGVEGATIAGGGGQAASGANRVTDYWGVVAGGQGNVAGNDSGSSSDAQTAAVGGGSGNRASGFASTVAGGAGNLAAGGTSTVAGGASNAALSEDATVAGGDANTASGSGSAVPGGFQNVAGGDFSFAAGFRAQVRDATASGDANGDEGTFVWADGVPPFAPFVSTGPGQFLVRASGGVGINTNAPATALDVNGIVRSRTGGFRFPDGTTQTTAATGGSGDITAVNTPAGGGLAGGATTGDANVTLFPCNDGLILKRTGTTWSCAQDANSGGTVTSVAAGVGLTGGTITTAGTLGVSFAGTGAAATVARSDHDHNATYAPLAHDHMGETWSDLTPWGLRIQMTTPGSRGVWAETSASDGYGLYGAVTATSGVNVGVAGASSSSQGFGVAGSATASTGPADGVIGATLSNGGNGVRGTAWATSGATSGVYGVSESSVGRGVFGLGNSNFGQPRGVHGESWSSQGFGVYGIATGTLGTGIGVFGTANAPNGTGVVGYSAAHGVTGEAFSTFGNGVFGNASAATGSGRGVTGQALSPTGVGVQGIGLATTGTAAGVWGETASTLGRAVIGRASATTGSGIAMSGTALATSGIAVLGEATASTGTTTGVWGQVSSPVNAYGVYGVAASTSLTSNSIGVVGETFSQSFQSYGVWGTAPPTAYAGFFTGRVHVNGSLSKASGSFKIDHPLDPENKYLYHSFVESPDMKNVYDGVVTTDGEGFAVVTMPDWFEALNRDFRYQLTVIGKGAWAHARIFEPMADGRFVIQTDRAAVQVSWQVTGIRKDQYAEKHRIPVEEDKPASERGTYLHPEEWGQPTEKGYDHGRRPSRQAPAPAETAASEGLALPLARPD